MKRIVCAFLIILAITSIGLCGCDGKSKEPEKKSAPKIGIIDADNDHVEEEKVPSREPAADTSKYDTAERPTEDIIQEAAELFAQNEAKEKRSDYINNIDPEPQDDINSEEMTLSQKNAVKAAIDYLKMTDFSHKGLVDQLSSEYGDQYPREDAEFAVKYLEDHNMVDWNEQAVRAAKNYMELTSFSRDGLIDQLTSEYGSQFTQEQAEYAVGQIGY